MASVLLSGYAQDPATGDGVVGARVRIYPMNFDKSRGVNFVETTSLSPHGAWSYTVDTDALASPTGLYLIEIQHNGRTRVIYPDARVQVSAIIGPNGKVPIPAQSVTGHMIENGAISDDKIGTRIINDWESPSSNTLSLTQMVNGLANRIKMITGESDWKANPSATLRDLQSGEVADHNHDGRYAFITHKERHGIGGLDRLYPQDIGAATASHSLGGGDIVTAVNDSNSLRGVAGGRFPYLHGAAFHASSPPSINNGPHRMLVGSSVVTVQSTLTCHIPYPAAFPTRTLWAMACSGDSTAYGGDIAIQTFDRTSMTVKATQASSGQTIRVNWMAFGD